MIAYVYYSILYAKNSYFTQKFHKYLIFIVYFADRSRRRPSQGLRIEDSSIIRALSLQKGTCNVSVPSGITAVSDNSQPERRLEPKADTAFCRWQRPYTDTGATSKMQAQRECAVQAYSGIRYPI